MLRSHHALRAVALAGAVALVLTACGNSDEDPAADPSSTGAAPAGDGALVIGSLLPQTGSLAFLGPPEIAGVDLAVEEINAAGGINGEDVVVHHADSSDADHADVAPQSWTDLQSKGVQAVIGAASSSVTQLVVDDIATAKVVMVSPANTATSLSGYSDFYFRTAPPDTVQGSALGNLIINDGVENLGMLVFNEEYGTSLRDVVKATVEDAGGTVTYGNQGEEFDPTAPSFADPVAGVMSSNGGKAPDAIAIIAFEQTKSIVPELVAAGFEGRIYMVDGNTADYSKDFEAGTLAAWTSQGTIPGAYPSDDFQARMLEVDPDLTDYSYGPESYDATMLIALAALKGGGVDGETIQKNMAAVSGADGGTKCTGFQECADLVKAGEDIDYEAVSGAGPFNADNDPSSAFIGIYQFNDDNTYKWVKAVEGSVEG
ncbi:MULTISPECIES: ABC transporter substrate-binding protein [Cellulomonas]|uniref:Extracellular ligand-binding receptor n=1 Tax=Cellulomonas gilvus (strain ATCC 13127 / NRRL B-14078) TaxID=593907 RepID=F8A520_CELGA|nr:MULTISPECIES: ABC transporter substrate-binding protein [Cellulomonas]AEI12123.1 Extracellular ligand-binding receptor [Cellulomonas gilvus ATCC 13127]MCR6690108.1 ABC transporter substrate-binding protein [Cellulomonas sp.]